MDSRKLMLEDNSMKGAFLLNEDGSWPGRASHEEQVGLDRQQATVCNRNAIRVGTWNVRTLYQNGNLENVKQEMIQLNINILGINEMRWPSNGDFMIENFKMIYAGGDNHEKGVGLLLDNNMAKCMHRY